MKNEIELLRMKINFCEKNMRNHPQTTEQMIELIALYRAKLRALIDEGKKKQSK